MKTTVTGSNKGNDKSSSPVVNGKMEINSEQPKINGLAVNTAFDDKPKDVAETKKTEIPAPVSELSKPEEAPKAEIAKPQTEQPKAEPVKDEAKEEVQPKIVLNLEGTLKLVEELHRRKIQRDRLLDTIDTLEAFEVAQIDDADETDANHFQGCVLTIEDDTRRKSRLKTLSLYRQLRSL